jgi:hypothetical protein
VSSSTDAIDATPSTRPIDATHRRDPSTRPIDVTLGPSTRPQRDPEMRTPSLCIVTRSPSMPPIFWIESAAGVRSVMQ